LAVVVTPDSRRVQLAQVAGVVAAMLIALFANVLVARHYRRWDWTVNKRYTLTDATLATLHELSDTVELWVLLGSADPLEQSVKQLLVAYQAESKKLDVHYVDPDRDPLALEDVRKRFKIQSGRTEDGRVVTDAILVAARGDKHWFVGPSDMVEVSDADDARAKPKEEQAITGAIRNVLGAEKARLCFTAGHGELSLADGSDKGLGLVKDILEKDNFAPVTVDTTEPNAHEPFKGCGVVVIAGALGAFTEDEDARLRTYLLEGGSLLAALSPINAESATGMAPAGIEAALSPFGIALDDDLVFETDEQLVLPRSRGIRFFAEAKEHPVTAALVRSKDGARDAPHVIVHFARSLHHTSKEGTTSAVDLLSTSNKSFALKSIAGAAEWTDAPAKKESDPGGPFVVAMASERPKTAPSAPHGPRVVVVGTGSVMVQANWMEPMQVRGAALFVENAISWLASKPQVLDVPARAAVPAGIRITEDSRAEVRRYVLVFMPAAVALLGLAIGLRRRSTEGKQRPPRGRGPAGSTRQREITGPGVSGVSPDDGAGAGPSRRASDGERGPEAPKNKL
jgi:hypothetical protein